MRLAPVFIQKRIQKKAEYRLTLISKQDVVCWIDAKHINDAEVTLDWGVTEPDKLVHVPDKLPIEYPSKLYQMLDELGLNFGAFDIISDEDDTLYFIELNPNGQWYWIEITAICEQPRHNK
jgi:glutathione synthase/RimK-type ligase-like ATP-grasp enzyme